MHKPASTLPWTLLAVILVSFSSVAWAQARPAAAPVIAPVATEKDLAGTQEQLIKLLRLSPTLTTVVARDPSLLSNQDYVSRNNPQLAQYLASHPEIARNPDFYLFTHLDSENGHPDQALERAVWPELQQAPYRQSPLQSVMGDVVPFFVFVCIAGALMWLIRVFLENRRWSRIFKLQTDVHGKLIDKFSSNDELLVYMNTEAGKRFLEAAPIPMNFETAQRVPNAVARVLNPLQIGIVLSLLGAGLLSLRHAHSGLDVPMLVLGTMVLMPGLGFILSAAVTWVLAGRLGLMPEGSAGARSSGTPLNPREQQ